MTLSTSFILFTLITLVVVFGSMLWYRHKWLYEEKRRKDSAEHDRLYIEGLAGGCREWKRKYNECMDGWNRLSGR